MIEELLEITRGLQRQIVRSGASESRITDEQDYLVRTPNARERKSLRTMLDAFLSRSMPEDLWELHDSNNGILINFHEAPSNRLLQAISDVIRDHPIMVTMQVPSSTKRTDGNLPE
jgi:hypothetical protein